MADENLEQTVEQLQKKVTELEQERDEAYATLDTIKDAFKKGIYGAALFAGACLILPHFSRRSYDVEVIAEAHADLDWGIQRIRVHCWEYKNKGVDTSIKTFEENRSILEQSEIGISLDLKKGKRYRITTWGWNIPRLGEYEKILTAQELTN